MRLLDLSFYIGINILEIWEQLLTAYPLYSGATKTSFTKHSNIIGLFYIVYVKLWLSQNEKYTPLGIWLPQGSVFPL